MSEAREEYYLYTPKPDVKAAVQSVYLSADQKPTETQGTEKTGQDRTSAVEPKTSHEHKLPIQPIIVETQPKTSHEHKLPIQPIIVETQPNTSHEHKLPIQPIIVETQPNTSHEHKLPIQPIIVETQPNTSHEHKLPIQPIIVETQPKTLHEHKLPIQPIVVETQSDELKTARPKRKKKEKLGKSGNIPSDDYFTPRSTSPEKKGWFSRMLVKSPAKSPTVQLVDITDVRFIAMIPDEGGLEPRAFHMTRKKFMPMGQSLSLSKQTYFHGMLPRDEIEKMLNRNGDFLVREAIVSGQKMYTISSKWDNKVNHFVIAQTRKGRYHIGFHIFDSVPDLIDWYLCAAMPLSSSTGSILKFKVHRQTWQLSREQIRICNKLGEGAFGEVYRAILVEGTKTTEVAVKTQSQAASVDVKEKIREFMAEFQTMREFKHPNVVKVYGVVAQDDPIMIIMEYLPNGSLLSYLRAQKIHVRLLNRIRFCLEAAAGMKYLEKKKVLHRDVAARNCLMGQKLEVKIADFGLTVFDVKEFREAKGKKVPIKWLAPETLRTGLYSSSTDIWSFGVLMWEIFADGMEPYPGLTNAQVRQQVTGTTCYRMKPQMGTPTAIIDLMLNRCWNEKPNKRPTFAVIYKVLKSLAKQYSS